MALFELIDSFKLTPPASGVGGLALIAGLAATLLPFEGPVWFTIRTCILFAAFSTVCLVCFCRTEGWFSRAFTWTPIRWLGNMSYSYYLLHGLALKGAFLLLSKFLQHDGHGPTFFVAMLPAMFAISLIPPAVLFIAVERPFSLVAKRKALKSGSTLKTLPEPIEATS